MSVKKVFSKFIGSVLVGMEKAVAAKNLKESECVFEWKKLGHVGATGVAEHLKEKHGLEASPTVVGGGEEPIPVFSVSHEKFRHEFQVGESRYHYVRVNGKAEERFKEFSAITTAFWVDFKRRKSNIGKRGKAKETKERDDASYKRYQEIQREKKEAKKKKEEEEAKKKKEEEEANKKKEEEEANKKGGTPTPGASVTPPPVTPSPETPPPVTPPPETPPRSTGEAASASGEPLPKE